MMVLAAGRFSITTGCPQSWLMAWAIRRATMSLGPRAGKGTIIRIGRLGKFADGSSAAAAPDADTARPAASRKRTARAIAPPEGFVLSIRAILTAARFAGNRFMSASHSKCDAHGLVSRFRSSHHCAAASFANFGIAGH